MYHRTEKTENTEYFPHRYLSSCQRGRGGLGEKPKEHCPAVKNIWSDLASKAHAVEFRNPQYKFPSHPELILTERDCWPASCCAFNKYIT